MIYAANTSGVGRVLVVHVPHLYMARQDAHTEYIVRKDAYQAAFDRLPATGSDGQTAEVGPLVAHEYRQNVSKTINSGKWSMWGISPQTFTFTWRNGAWQPPANLVVRQE